jgi:hypothetical protein
MKGRADGVEEMVALLQLRLCASYHSGLVSRGNCSRVIHFTLTW